MMVFSLVNHMGLTCFNALSLVRYSRYIFFSHPNKFKEILLFFLNLGISQILTGNVRTENSKLLVY